MKPLVVADGRMGLFSTIATVYEPARVFSALYFAGPEACITFEEPVTMHIILPDDRELVDSFIYRVFRATYTAFKARATAEDELAPAHLKGVGAYIYETRDIELTKAGNPRLDEHWVSVLECVSESTHEYVLRVQNHVTFGIIVDAVEKSRTLGKSFRLFHRSQKAMVDCTVGWPSAGSAPTFLEAARLSMRGKSLAFLPNPGAGLIRYNFALLSVGEAGEIVRLVQPKLFAPTDGTCVIHLVPPPQPTLPGTKKRTHDDDSKKQLAKGQMTLTSMFDRRAKKARLEEEVASNTPAQ